MRTLGWFAATLVLFAVVPAFAASSAYTVALLVHESDEQVVDATLRAAFAVGTPLTRATAARVAAVRGSESALPLLRSALAAETDALAAREQIRALALIGSLEDVKAAAAASAKWPAAMDNALALAVAHRGGVPAIQLYADVLNATRMTNRAEFFRVALWSPANALSFAGARLIANGDAPGWTGLLSALHDSNIAMPGGMIASSLTSPSEELRSASVWYLVRGYAPDPAAIPQIVRETLSAPQGELSSDREDFARELLARMSGAAPKSSERWLRFLGSEEADRLLAGDDGAVQYLTEEEYALRFARCEVQIRDCAMPRKRGRREVPAIPVTPPAFQLPSPLPAGLADAIVDGAKCSASWIGVAEVKLDASGRVRELDLERLFTNKTCKRAVETLLRLSFASPTSIRSGFRGPALLVRPQRSSLCLDEDPPESATFATYRAGGAVEAPKVKKRVEPAFPRAAREAMSGHSNVVILVEAMITKHGCVRNLRLIEQSPYPDLNAAALHALAQWTFAPGRLDGAPVDTLFTLTINFKLQ